MARTDLYVMDGKSMVYFSIIVPIYKVEKYLRRSMDSLVNQTLDGVEIICINDGSPDNCLSILKEYKEKYTDKNIQYTYNWNCMYDIRHLKWI